MSQPLLQESWYVIHASGFPRGRIKARSASSCGTRSAALERTVISARVLLFGARVQPLRSRRTMTESNEMLAGDGAADSALFSHMFELHRVALRRYAERFVSSRDTAEDLVQDVFSRLWVRWRGIDVASNVRAYLYQATRTHALNHLERRRVEQRGLLRYVGPVSADVGPVLPPEGEARVQADDVTRAVERVLRLMPPRQREVASLRLRDQLTTPEIAAKLGISPRTVEVHIARATRLLRDRLPTLLGHRRPITS
jgi:RNA polymerase sigma-70 factor, ECF subfamily